jgi:hypothetical protein
MRSFLLGLLVGSLVVSTLAAMPQFNKRETIWVGTDLTLGMSEDAAIKKLAESGYSPRKMGPVSESSLNEGVTSMWDVDEKDEGGKLHSIGVITFASGKLNTAMKLLLPFEEVNDVEFGRRLYFAMRELEQEGDTHCTIETTNGETPDYSHKSAQLNCGKKAIVIELQNFQKRGENVQLNEELSNR